MKVALIAGAQRRHRARQRPVVEAAGGHGVLQAPSLRQPGDHGGARRGSRSRRASGRCRDAPTSWSRAAGWQADGALVAHGPRRRWSWPWNRSRPIRTACARLRIGGAELYALALPHADEMVLTEIDRDYDGDARFPVRRAAAASSRRPRAPPRRRAQRLDRAPSPPATAPARGTLIDMAARRRLRSRRYDQRSAAGSAAPSTTKADLVVTERKTPTSRASSSAALRVGRRTDSQRRARRPRAPDRRLSAATATSATPRTRSTTHLRGRNGVARPGATLGLCTSKRADFAEQILALFGMRELFAFVSGGDSGVHSGSSCRRCARRAPPTAIRWTGRLRGRRRLRAPQRPARVRRPVGLRLARRAAGRAPATSRRSRKICSACCTPSTCN